MWRLESFCYGIPLKSAATIYAVLSLGSSILAPLAASLFLVFNGLHDKLGIKLEGSGIPRGLTSYTTSASNLQSVGWGAFLLLCIPLILDTMLLVGIIKEISTLLKIYFWIYLIKNFVFGVLIIIPGIIAMVQLYILAFIPTIFIFLLVIPVPVYLLFTIYSLAYDFDVEQRRVYNQVALTDPHYNYKQNY